MGNVGVAGEVIFPVCFPVLLGEHVLLVFERCKLRFTCAVHTAEHSNSLYLKEF